MTTYLFCLQIEPYVVTGHYILEKYYNKKKHGLIQHKDKLDYKLTRREQYWYARNYMSMWCFTH